MTILSRKSKSLYHDKHGKLFYRFGHDFDLPSVAKTDEDVISSFKRRITECITLPSKHFYTLSQLLFRGFSLKSVSEWEGDLVMKHGPGAVAEGFTQIQKDLVRRIHDTRYESLVSETYFRNLFPRDCDEPMPSDWTLKDSLRQDYPERSIEGAQSSRVALVPKDYRGPRVIAAEPALHQYVQQGVMCELVRHIRQSLFGLSIHLKDQGYNRNAALEGSRDGTLDTIDLSDASDTVRVAHIVRLLEARPDILDVILRLRTESVALPGSGEVVTMTTAFPMGSPLCFPFESMIFFFVLVGEAGATFEQFRWRNTSATLVSDIVRELGLLVYGDDIVIRHEHSSWALSTLESWGFVPNRSKCCTAGFPFFRESCGADCAFGCDVTPLRPRNLPGGSDVSYEGLTSMATDFARKGLARAALYLIQVVQEEFRCCVPIVPSDVNLPGCVASSELWGLADEPYRRRYSTALQTWRISVLRSKYALVGVGSMRRLREALAPRQEDECDPEPFRGWPQGRRPYYYYALVTVGSVKPYWFTTSRLKSLLALDEG